jgi:hypothetical protein
VSLHRYWADRSAVVAADKLSGFIAGRFLKLVFFQLVDVGVVFFVVS